MRVCLSVTSLGFLEGGGHRWAYLNWALGLKSIGCEVTWLEEVADRIPDGLHGPRPAHSRAYASPSASPRPSQGSLPIRAGSPLIGRVSHPLDD
jgi:hypothetical protein